MHEVVKVQLRAIGEVSCFITNGIKVEIGDNVVVEADRGLDHGIVVGAPENVETLDKLEQPVRKMIRKANPWDEKQI
jgi:cell fate regulator YaaT (PSP1 superfamily)